MLNFKNTNIAFLILILLCVIYIYSYSEGYIYLLFITLFYFLILSNGVFDISSGFFIKPINFVKTNRKKS